MRDRLQIVPYVIQYAKLVGIGCKIHEERFTITSSEEREIALQAVKNHQCGLYGNRRMLIEIVGLANASAVAQHGHENSHSAC